MSADWSFIPDYPAPFKMTVRISMTTIRPFRDCAMQLNPGDPLRLVLQPDNLRDPCAVAVYRSDGQCAGYLYAEQAAWVSMLLRTIPSWHDHSFVSNIIRYPDPMQHLPRKRRYPIVHATVVLDLPTVRTLYTIAAMIGFRRSDFLTFFHVDENSYLKPLIEGYRLVRTCEYDSFEMPESLIRSWIEITRSVGQSRAETMLPADES